MSGMSIRGTRVPTIAYWLIGFAGAWPGWMPPLKPPAFGVAGCTGAMFQLAGIVTLKNFPPSNWP